MKRYILSLIAAAALVVAAAPNAKTSHAQEPGRAPVVWTDDGEYVGFSTPLVLGPVSLSAGLVVVHARHGGNANFSVSLVTADPGKAPEDSYDNRYLLINSIGRYNGAAAELLRKSGEYYLLVGAAGRYDFRVEQPTSDNVTPVTTRQFSGEHQQVTPVFRLEAGTHTLSAGSDGTGNLHVWLYLVDDLGGAAINGDYAGRLIAVTSGPAEEAVTFTTRRPGLYLVHVYASSIQTPTSGASWSIRVE